MASKLIFYYGGNIHSWRGVAGFEKLLDALPAICFTYYYKEGFEALKTEVRSRGIHVFLDSGAFSFLRAADRSGKRLDRKQADSLIEEYAAWIRKQEQDFAFDFVCTFDYVRDPKEVLRVTRRLEMLGVPAVPVYHAGTSITALHKLIDEGYKRICISRGTEFTRHGQTRAFLDQVFQVTEKAGVECHGLACTSSQVLRGYPWYSVDSTSWMASAAYGYTISLDGERRPSSKLKATVAGNQEDNYVLRGLANVKAYQALLERIAPPTLRRTLF